MGLKPQESRSIDLGLEARKKADRHWGRMAFFAVLLLISHVVTLGPSEYNSGGIKASIDDPALVHGGIAIIFLYHLVEWFLAASEGGVLVSDGGRWSLYRGMLRIANRTTRDPHTKRRRVRTKAERKVWATFYLSAYQVVRRSYLVLIGVVAVASFLLAVSDVFDLLVYAGEKIQYPEDFKPPLSNYTQWN